MVSLLWQCGGRAITPIKGECPAIKRQREWVEERHEGQSSIKKKNYVVLCQKQETGSCDTWQDRQGRASCLKFVAL